MNQKFRIERVRMVIFVKLSLISWWSGWSGWWSESAAVTPNHASPPMTDQKNKLPACIWTQHLQICVPSGWRTSPHPLLPGRWHHLHPPQRDLSILIGWIVFIDGRIKAGVCLGAAEAGPGDESMRIRWCGWMFVRHRYQVSARGGAIGESRPRYWSQLLNPLQSAFHQRGDESEAPGRDGGPLNGELMRRIIHSRSNLGVMWNNFSNFPHEHPYLLFVAEVGLISSHLTWSISPAAPAGAAFYLMFWDVTRNSC